jgi:hypothetical protein
VPVFQSLDQFSLSAPSRQELYGYEMSAAIAAKTNVTFETITPQEISSALQEQLADSPQGRNYNGPWLLQLAGMPWHGAAWHGTDDYLYIFQTWDGGQTGVLQIIGFTNKPQGVKIRYKLVGKTEARINDAKP